MPLPKSGQISMWQLRAEVGGSGQVSMNDAAVRGLIGKASGAQNAMSEYHGASAHPTYTVTIGSTQDKYGNYTYGFVAGVFGSLSPTVFNGRTVTRVSWVGADMTITFDGNNLTNTFLYKVSANGVIVTQSNHSGTTFYFTFPSNLPTSGSLAVGFIQA